MHWLDMYWIVMPNYFRVEEAAVTSLLSWTDFSLILAMGGLLWPYIGDYLRLFQLPLFMMKITLNQFQKRSPDVL